MNEVTYLSLAPEPGAFEALLEASRVAYAYSVDHDDATARVLAELWSEAADTCPLAWHSPVVQAALAFAKVWDFE